MKNMLKEIFININILIINNNKTKIVFEAPFGACYEARFEARFEARSRETSNNIYKGHLEGYKCC